MATLAFDDDAIEDLSRLARFLAQADPSGALAVLELIRTAVSLLEEHPLIGRPTNGELRELVISLGATGYIALYGYSPLADHVQIHGIRHQREAGFDD